MGGRMEFYPKLSETQEGGYFTLGSFFEQFSIDECGPNYVAYIGGGSHNKIKWRVLGDGFHSKLGAGLSVFKYGCPSDPLLIPFIELKIGVTI